METNKNKIMTKNKPPQVQQPPDQIMVLNNAFNQLAHTVALLTVEIKQNTANLSIMKSTIELIEKRMDFDDKKNKNR